MFSHLGVDKLLNKEPKFSISSELTGTVFDRKSSCVLSMSSQFRVMKIYSAVIICQVCLPHGWRSSGWTFLVLDTVCVNFCTDLEW